MKPISALKIILFALSLGMLAACEKAAYDDESIKKDDTHIIEGDDDENSDQQGNGGTGGSSTDTTSPTIRKTQPIKTIPRPSSIRTLKMAMTKAQKAQKRTR